MASWEEVKRLAADFQKVQLSSTTQKLSERNCIEIISWLIERKLINLIFTSDGKEYMTPTQLGQDILAELYVNGGRVNFVELSKTIGVDFNNIVHYVPEVIRGRKDIFSILGQLIDNSYIVKIAGEINQKLSQQGQINVGDLTLQYDLPAEFLQNRVLDKYLGKLIIGEQDKSDPRVYFTESFIAQTKSKIKGALVALTRPTSINVILNQIGVRDKLFFSLYDQLTPCGFLTGPTVGANYVPNVYSRSQNEWVQNFYKQNGYLEFDTLIRLGINDYKTYLKKHFSNEIMLKSCILSERLTDRIDADVEECIASKSYVDLQSNLPNVLDDDDIKIIIDKVLTSQKVRNIVVLDNYLISKVFLESLSKDCDAFLQDQAKHIFESGKYQRYQTELQMQSSKPHKGDADIEDKVDKREERRKRAASGKSGGGAQGRETKTKSTKKAIRTVKNLIEDDSYEPDKKITLNIITFEDVEKLIEKKLESEGLSEISDNIVNYLLPTLNNNGLEIAAKLYACTVADRTAARRHTHNDVQNKVNALLGDVRLFEKGLKCFPADIQAQLHKYLLKTICLDILNELLNYIASEKGHNVDTEKFTNEQRLKFINDLSSEYKTPFQMVFKTLSGQNVEEFMVATEESLTICSMILKKIDKKKDRLIVLNHKHGLLEQLDICEDPALALHLCSLVIFISATQCMLHASGKYVSSILSYLKPHLTNEQSTALSVYHDLVLLMLNAGPEAENAKEQLKEKLSAIKTIAIDYKKMSDKN
ncbi:hypothetical protein FQA39_LY04851 [Lamprigera yunnana]|nr:hypothetical protein FQA39_LY04851 [Lamprigera yunnana]